MNTIESNSSNNASLIVTIGVWLTGIGLILLSIQCFVYPGVAEGYGVWPVDENGFAYLLATGMRDLFMGIATIYLLLRFRDALAFYFLAMIIVPVADTLIVLRYGESWISIWPHVAGMLVLAAISFAAHRENANKKLISKE